jgi:hypothetical protein
MIRLIIQLSVALVSNIAITELCLVIGTEVYWRGFLTGCISMALCMGAGLIYDEYKKSCAAE